MTDEHRGGAIGSVQVGGVHIRHDLDSGRERDRVWQKTQERQVMRLWLLLAAATVVAVIVLRFPLLRTTDVSRTPNERAVPVQSGTVVINVVPWATIETLRASDGTEFANRNGGIVTPVMLSLPAGQYTLRARNPYFVQPLETSFEVSTGQSQQVRLIIPGFRPEDEVEKVLAAASQARAKEK
jgi:hypothetical protein